MLERQTLCLLGSSSATLNQTNTSPFVLFSLVLFWIESPIFAQSPPQALIFLLMASQIAGITDMCHHAFWMILDDLLDVLKETAVY
jgi:hypothetical protein